MGLKERRRVSSPKTAPIESTKTSASAWETPVGGASRAPVSPGNLEILETALSNRSTSEREFQTLRLYLSLGKHKVPYRECNCRLMTVVLRVTRSVFVSSFGIESLPHRTNSSKCDMCGRSKSRQHERERVVSIGSRL